jgi:hypothetical protein
MGTVDRFFNDLLLVVRAEAEMEREPEALLPSQECNLKDARTR